MKSKYAQNAILTYANKFGIKVQGIVLYVILNVAPMGTS